MVKKKIWITVLVLFTLCTSLFIVYASMRNNSSGDINDSIFSDVSDRDWFCSDVRYAKEKGLMSGTAETVFSPYETMTRAMVVTVLWRLDGQPKGSNVTFTDVKSDAYYFDAVSWAAENKIVSGYNEKTFASDDNVTREQLATIFYRFAEHKGYDISKKADLISYTDFKTISNYAVNAFEWAVANGIITGTSESTISPQGNALRCQVAAILKRFCTVYINADNEKHEIVTSGNIEENNSDSNTGSKSISDSGNKINASIKVSEATASQGEDAQIIAKIENNPGILGMTLTLNFDENALSLKEAENGNVFRDVLDFTPSKTLLNGARFVWDGIDITSDKIKDGEILIMDFHILENAKPGKYPITLTYTTGDIVDNNLSTVDLTMKTGYITIKN